MPFTTRFMYRYVTAIRAALRVSRRLGPFRAAGPGHPWEDRTSPVPWKRSDTTMIGTDTISRVIGQDVYDESGEKIGSAAEVYLDDETGQPEWVTVRTGLFGTKESFVPIRQADLTDDGLRVPVSKSAVKDAPKIDTEGHLSPQEGQELYRYYGMDFGSGSVGRTDTTNGRTDTTVGRADRPGTAGTTTGTESTTGMATTGTAGQGIGDRDLTDRDRDLTGTDAGHGRHTDTRPAVGHDTSGPTTDN